jgi:xylan 1,4-beta-xylosidase
VDAEHSNAFTAWRNMGSPLPLSEKQFLELERAGKLATFSQPEAVLIENSRLRLNLSVPRQAVVMLVFDIDNATQ